MRGKLHLCKLVVAAATHLPFEGEVAAKRRVGVTPPSAEAGTAATGVSLFSPRGRRCPKGV
jgi:hypothetical protein